MTVTAGARLGEFAGPFELRAPRGFGGRHPVAFSLRGPSHLTVIDRTASHAVVIDPVARSLRPGRYTVVLRVGGHARSITAALRIARPNPVLTPRPVPTAVPTAVPTLTPTTVTTAPTTSPRPPAPPTRPTTTASTTITTSTTRTTPPPAPAPPTITTAPKPPTSTAPTSATTAPKPPTSSTSAVPSGDQAGEVVRLTNQQRVAAGCPALTMNATLARVAQAHSADMATRNYFSHTSLDGRSPFDRMSAAGYSYRLAAENIAAGQPTPQAVVDGWMNSPGHRANILNCSLTEIGVGVATGGSYRIYWTQDFGTPR